MMSTPSTPIFTRRGYGCQREVYHPLSKHAESTAVMYYESSDEEDEVGEVGNNTPLPPRAVKSIIVTPSSAATSLVLRRESTAVSTPTSTQTTPVKKTFVPKKPPMAVARKGPVDRKGKGTEKQSIFLLDEMAAMNLEKPGEPSSPVSKRPLPPPSTPPRQKRIPFSLLTPENTFGASSPFKIRANGSGGDREKEGGKENGSWGSSYDYGSIPGGFDGW